MRRKIIDFLIESNLFIRHENDIFIRNIEEGCNINIKINRYRLLIHYKYNSIVLEEITNIFIDDITIYDFINILETIKEEKLNKYCAQYSRNLKLRKLC